MSRSLTFFISSQTGIGRITLEIPARTSLGIIPGLLGAPRLAERIGAPVAFYHVVTGDTGENALSAQEARDLGLVDFVVSPAALSRSTRFSRRNIFAGLPANKDR